MMDSSKIKSVKQARDVSEAIGDLHLYAATKTRINFVRALGIFLSSRIVSAAALLTIGIITARILGPESRGQYALFFTIVGLGLNLAGFGLTQSNIYFLNRERVPMSILFGNTLLAIAIVGITVGALIGILEVVACTESWGFPGWVLWLAITSALLEAHVSGLVYGSHLHSFQSRSLVVQAVLLMTATVLIIPIGANLSTALYLRVGVSLIFVGWYVKRFTSIVALEDIAVNIGTLRAQVRFGMKNWIQNVIGILNYRVYMLILAAFSGPELVGYFSIALLFAEAIRFIPETLGTMLLPKLVSVLPGAAPAHLAARASRVIIFGMGILGLGLAVLADWIVPIVFGVEYTDATMAIKALLPGAVAGTVYQILTRYFTSEHAQKYSTISGIVGLVVAGVASLLLIPDYGATGASVAFSVSALATCISMLWGFGKQSNLSPIKAIIPTCEDFEIFRKLVTLKIA